MEQIEQSVSDKDLLALAIKGAPAEGSRWLHVKTGGVYRVLCRALREEDGTPCVVYVRESTGVIWVRPTGQFMDGRFSKIT